MCRDRGLIIARWMHAMVPRVLMVRQVEDPDDRVTQLVSELAAGPIPGWDPPPSILVLNKVRRCDRENDISELTLRRRHS